jgi:hypothetical protein
MRIQIPKSIRLEHEELHDFLAAVRHEPGELGDTLRRVARLLEPHFRKEEAFALPPLGLLVRLARNDVNAAMAEVYPHTEWLKNNLPTLMAEHDAIGAAVQEMLQAARAADRVDYIEIAEKLVNHLRMEEEVMYPAAILVGEYLRLLLGTNARIDAL